MTNSSESLPTLARFPSVTAIDTRAIPTDMPIIGLNQSQSVVMSPTITVLSITASATITATLIPINTSSALSDTPIPTPRLQDIPTATPLPAAFVFGQSVDRHELRAFRYGTGGNVIMLIAGIHAGFEANTVELMEEFQAYFENNPGRINDNISFIIVPVLNPDGLSQGRVLKGRFNGNQVDLNRNWACGWSKNAIFQNGPVDSGTHAFSEPETIALGSLIQRVNPKVVLFYHSAANGVFAGSCEGHETISFKLAEIYGEASGYPYGEPFSAYPVTGTAPAWLASLGIPALDVELSTATGIEFERNLRAVLSVQEWILEP